MTIALKILRISPVFSIALVFMMLYSSTTSLSSQAFGVSPKSRLKPALYYHFPGTVIEKIQHIFPYIVVKSRENEVSLPFVLAVIKAESNFKQDAVSQAGALGLMQLMPNTAKAQYIKVVNNVRIRDLKKNLILHPELNIVLGIKYLQHLKNTLKGINNTEYRRKMIMAAYNAGLSRVKKSFQCKTNASLVQLINTNSEKYFNQSVQRLPRETRNYIQKVSRKYHQYNGYLENVSALI